MIATLALWVLAIYGLMTILLQWVKRNNEFFRKDKTWEVHLLLHNSEKNLEKTIRSLVQFSRLNGQPLRLIAHDYGSTDQTEKILAAFEKKHPYLFEKKRVVANDRFDLASMEKDSYADSRLTIDLRQELRDDSFQTT